MLCQNSGLNEGEAMIHIHYFITRLEKLSNAEFHNYWRDTHGPIAGRIPQLHRYVQSHRIQAAGAVGAESPYDGEAEVLIDSTDAFAELRKSQEYLEGALDDKPDVLGFLSAVGHKNLNPSEVYPINYLDIKMIDALQWSIAKETMVIRTASVIARYLAGVIFHVCGLNSFLNFIPLPPPGGIAGQFMGALYASHYLWVIFAFQVIAAVLLLVNRYVPLAVAVLAPVIVNILVFHALMAPSGLPLALFVAVLWAVIFVNVRPAFAGLFQSRLQTPA